MELTLVICLPFEERWLQVHRSFALRLRPMDAIAFCELDFQQTRLRVKLTYLSVNDRNPTCALLAFRETFAVLDYSTACFVASAQLIVWHEW